MVEAAIIFPLVILSVVTVIYIVINMYTEVTTVAKLHMIASEAAADESGTIIYSDKWEDGERDPWIADSIISTKIHNGPVHNYVSGKAKNTASANGLIKAEKQRKYETEKSIIDEERLVRLKDLIKI